MEGNIDTLERNGCETSLEIERFGLSIGLFGASLNNLNKVCLHILNRECLHQLLNVNLLCLEVVGDTSEGVKSAEVTSTDVLHVCNVVVDNLQEPSSLFSDVLNNVLK